MFLSFISINKLLPLTSVTRNSIKYKNFFCLQKKHKLLSFSKKWNAGRSSKGDVIIWTKSSLKRKLRRIRINYDIRLNKLSFIASFQFIEFRNKILSLVYFSNGLISYYITTDKHILFNFYFLNKNKKLKKFFELPIWSILSQIKKLSLISFIELAPGKCAQYCLSSGTFSKLLSIDKNEKLVLILLPSKVKKLISYYSCVFNGKIALEENKKYLNFKAGYWRLFGKKPIVRGVAMNSVDHPHGGRTKAIKYQRTPWGKTTKFK